MILGLLSEKEFLNFVNLKIKPDVGAEKVLSSLMTCIANKQQTITPITEEDIKETEAISGALPVVRTMKDDSTHEEKMVHASSQETLLKKESVLPAPSKIPPPPST